MPAYFDCSGRSDVRIMLSKFSKRNSEKMSEFLLIIFVRISLFCVAFVGLNCLFDKVDPPYLLCETINKQKNLYFL